MSQLSITDNRSETVKRFDELSVGQIFDKGSNIFIKIHTFTDVEGYEKNALCLDDTYAHYFDEHIQVEPLRAELVVEEEIIKER